MLLMEGESFVKEGVVMLWRPCAVKRVPVLLIAFGGPCKASHRAILVLRCSARTFAIHRRPGRRKHHYPCIYWQHGTGCHY